MKKTKTIGVFFDALELFISGSIEQGLTMSYVPGVGSLNAWDAEERPGWSQ
jgi:hypothetical protein